MDKQGAAALWEKASQLIKSEINSVSYDYWFQDLQPADWDGEKLTLMADNDFGRNLLKEKYDELIRTALQRAAGRPVSYVILTPAEAAAPVKSAPPAAPDKNSGSMLNPKYTFSTYVIGKSNNFAHAAAYAVSQSPGDTYNPLFLYSGVGLGKTHLMHAIGHAILEKNPSARILYITSETFTNDLVKAIGSNTNFEFRNRYRNVDVLMVDDIQFIAGKEQTQEEFFHTFNALYNEKKQIILTSDRPPRDISYLESRLQTRFESGLMADIQPPDTELRAAIFKMKTQLLGIRLDNEVLTYLSENITNNVRQIEGALKRLRAQSFITGEPISKAMAADVLKDFFTTDGAERVTIEKVFSFVSRRYGFSTEDIRGKKRTSDIVYVRHIAMYLCTEYTGLSLKAIGRQFGRDHSTVINARDNVINRMKKDSAFDKEIRELSKELTTL